MFLVRNFSHLRDHKSYGLLSVKTLNMQDKMECDWFKPSTHMESSMMIKKYSTFATCKQNARNAKQNTFKMKKTSNTDVNKLNWRF